MIVKMPIETRIMSESYHVPLHSSIVTIETVEKIFNDDTYHYFTLVSWQNDADEDVIFESHTREDALHRHERLCRCFRKYQWFWKPVKAESRTESMLVAAVV